MRSFLTILLSLASAMTLRADTFVYVSMAPEQKIQVYRLDPAEGKLTAVQAIPVQGAPGALAIDPKRKFLFASLRSTSNLASFRINLMTGKLKLLSTARLPKGENAAYVGTDRTGRWLLSASYAAGKVVVHRIKDDGTIQTPAVQTIATAQTAHSTVFDRDNRLVFVPHVAANAIYQFRFDKASGQLTEAGKAKGGSDRAGPRHLTFHPTLKVAYTSNETGSSITAYRFNAKEGLKPFQTLSTLPANFEGPNTTAEVKVHPSGKFVWVSNRGHDSLAGFAIDTKSGKLKALAHTPTAKTPRSFDVTPDGRFLLAAGEGSGKLAIYRVDLDAAKLTFRHTYDVGKSLTWILAPLDDPKSGLARFGPYSGEGLIKAIEDTQKAVVGSRGPSKHEDDPLQHNDDRRPGPIATLVRDSPWLACLLAAIILGVIILAGLLFAKKTAGPTGKSKEKGPGVD